MTAIATRAAAAAASSAAPVIRGSESRLRRGGLLRAAAGLAAATAVAGAQASVVYSGALNQNFLYQFYAPGTNNPLQQQANITIAANEPLSLNVREDKGAQYLQLTSYSSDFHLVQAGKSGPFQLFSGLGGDFIDGTDTYASASTLNSDNINSGTTAYFGFKFGGVTDGKSSVTLPLLYGWGKFTSNGNAVWVLNSYAYENSGAGILTGNTGAVVADPNAVPEPGTVPLVAAAGLAAALLWRRRT